MEIHVPSGKDLQYGVLWPKTVPQWCRERDMLRRGGRFKRQNGTMAGEGKRYHLHKFISLLWPEINWNKWSELQLDCWCKYRIIGQLGCASSGKSFVPAACLMADYYVFPDCCTGLVSSTTKESLEMRVLGEIKRLHRSARERFPHLPGYLIEGRQRIVTDPRDESSDGRDFRNGVLGVACLRGQQFQGITSVVGIKNKLLRLLADELQFLPRVFIDSIANLNKNPDFKCVGSGNPKETTDALGVLCEPAAHLGGWEGSIDQTPVTKTWETRFDQGICIQFPGSDSPNLDGKLGIPLITQEQIDADIKFYGKDSIQYSMMDEGRMPKGQGNRRVLTRQMCVKFGAMGEPNWRDSQRTRIGFLDAAYRGVGGDRCVFGQLEFGYETDPVDGSTLVSNLISQGPTTQSKKQIVNLVDTMVVPITMDDAKLPEDQIVAFVKDQCEQRRIPPGNFFFDSGMRTSLVTAFSRLWSNEVNSVDCGARPSDLPVSSEITVACKDYYSKFITELWFSVRMVVESRQFRGMTEDVMMEFSQREWIIVSGNKIEVEPKKAMKVRIGRSPDLADAVAVGLYGARKLGFTIQRLSEARKPARRHGERDWRDSERERAADLWRSKALTFS